MDLSHEFAESLRFADGPAMIGPYRYIIGLLRVAYEGTHWRPDAHGRPHLIAPVFDRRFYLHSLAEAWPSVDKAPDLMRKLHVAMDFSGNLLDVVDLVAWLPNGGAPARLRCGNVACLGEWNLDRIGDIDETLHVVETMAAWHASGQRAVLVFDWGAVAPMLLDWPCVQAETPGLGFRVERAVMSAKARATPRAPDIVVARH